MDANPCASARGQPGSKSYVFERFGPKSAVFVRFGTDLAVLGKADYAAAASSAGWAFAPEGLGIRHRYLHHFTGVGQCCGARHRVQEPFWFSQSPVISGCAIRNSVQGSITSIPHCQGRIPPRCSLFATSSLFILCCYGPYSLQGQLGFQFLVQVVVVGK